MEIWEQNLLRLLFPVIMMNEFNDSTKGQAEASLELFTKGDLFPGFHTISWCQEGAIFNIIHR